MSLRQYMILMAIGSAIGWGTWVLVLFKINPFSAGAFGFTVFYASLALALIGTLSLAGFALRLWVFHNEEIVLRQVTTAFRQACLLSFLLAGSLFLQSRELLAWWNILIFVSLLSIIELFALSLKRRN